MNVKNILVSLLLIMISTAAITECNGGRSKKAKQCTGASCSMESGKQDKQRRHMRHHGKHHGKRQGDWRMRNRGKTGQGMQDKGIKAQSAEKETTSGSEEAVESKD